MGQTSEQGTVGLRLRPQSIQLFASQPDGRRISEGGVYAGEACGQFLNRPPAAVLWNRLEGGAKAPAASLCGGKAVASTAHGQGCWEGEADCQRRQSSGGLEAQEVGEWARQADAVTSLLTSVHSKAAGEAGQEGKRRTPRQSRPR